jgi:hypothetical protein
MIEKTDVGAGDGAPKELTLERSVVTLDEQVDALHQRFFVIRIGGKAYVGDRNATDIVGDLMPVESFKTLFSNGKIEKNDPIDIWLKSPKRVRLMGFDFNPNNPYGDAVGDQFNLYQGPAVQPIEGDCQIIIDHIHEVLCSGNSEQSEHMLNWIAHMFQKPGEQCGTSIILQSGEGTGKSLITTMLNNIWGVHGTQVSSTNQLIGNHNTQLAKKMLISIEEVSTAHNIEATIQMKNLVTSPIITINPKMKASFDIVNFARLMLNTNQIWAFAASKEARRWFVPTISDDRVGDRAYFNALAKATLSAPVQSALLHFMLERDISAFDPQERPDTEALDAQKRQTMEKLDHPLAWLTGVLESGEFELERYHTLYRSQRWLNDKPILANVLRESYEHFVAKKKNPPRWTNAAKRLKEIWPDLDHTRIRVDGGDRKYHYRLPPIEDARGAFESYAGVALEPLPDDYGVDDCPVFDPNDKRVTNIHNHDKGSLRNDNVRSKGRHQPPS